MSDASYKHTVGIVRTLGRRGHCVTVLASGPDDLASRSRYCSSVEYVPDSADPRFAVAVARVLERNPQDLIIPVGYAATLRLAESRDQLPQFVRMETADLAQIQFAADKARVRQLAMELRVPAPKTLYPSGFEELQECAAQFGYPMLLKPRCEGPKGRVHCVRDANALRRASLGWVSNHANGNEMPMVQEFIPGYGCGFFALYQHGQCKRIFMHRRVREDTPDAGASSCAESFYSERLKELGMKMLTALEWHGVAMVEFRYDERDRDFKLLEINPKFWGSLDLALAAGVDFPSYLCAIATGEDLTYSEDYQRNLRFQWFFSGDLQHMARRPSSAAHVLVDCLNPRVKSNVWLGDLGPNVQEARLAAKALWRRVRK